MDSRVSDALVAIRRIVRAAEFASRDLTRATGLTPSQLIVMQIVARAGEPGAGAIAEAARLSQATVPALLDKLEARGFIVRQKPPPDRRRITVALTEAGRRACRTTNRPRSSPPWNGSQPSWTPKASTPRRCSTWGGWIRRAFSPSAAPRGRPRGRR
ncbi:MAG TPA: MarR family winged helix-turn-helix transcriptional regulator [Phenylobacterium sp.]|nr:MarR family winged helix-turn-helix transcriptional regulator [Phenylobacterium sp.]